MGGRVSGMIAQISGTVIEVRENAVVLQVNEIGYEIFVPSSVINSFRKKSQEAKPSRPLGKETSKETNSSDIFYTIQYLEGSSGHGNQFVRLVGFKRSIEKEFFQVYTSVEGIGYKTALKSLILPIHKIALAIETNDLTTLKKLPHIGSRTAEKMVATLKGRMQKFALDLQATPLTVRSEEDFHSEVLQVLYQIGYKDSEALELMESALQKNPKIKNAEEMIQQIFKMQNEATGSQVPKR